MQYVKYSNGCILEWDDTISVGELIHTCYKGYWILSRIEFKTPKPRVPSLKGTIFDNYPIEWSNKELYEDVPIFHFTQVLRDDGTRSKSNTKSCHACYCSRVTRQQVYDQYHTETRIAAEKQLALLNFLPA